ncbi:MAG: hypothetical protein IIB15_03005, partial [Chloroflexi bacterium]|nr:hypothetical protein [Chloroflexota bacterium]
MARNLADLLGAVVRRGRTEESVPTSRDICFVCGASLLESSLYIQYRVCPGCNFHYTMTARSRIDSLVHPDSLREINRSIIT